uniref:ShKT domain-containing protein n=1 Tax=Strongyloides venezuelensis TaxID=75913 RepID=A0A0K0F8U1_STRVS
MKLYNLFILYKYNWIKFLYFIITLFPIRNVVSDKVSHDFCPNIYNEQIQNCVLPVSQYAKILHQQNGKSTNKEFNQAFSIPKVGKEVFHELCRLIRNFDTCIFKLREECPNHITINLIDASYGYLCNEAYDVFLNSAECLMELDLQPNIKQCHDETLQEIEAISGTSAITLHLKLERMCNALNFFSSCVRNPIKEKCGNDAWHVIYHVLKYTTKTLMPGCTFNSNYHTQKHHVKNIHTHENINNNNNVVTNYTMNNNKVRNSNNETSLETTHRRNKENEAGKIGSKIKSRIEKIENELYSTSIDILDYNVELFENTSSIENLVSNCLDINPHCKKLQRACLLPTYRTKMIIECPLTCKLCVSNEKKSNDQFNVDYNSSSIQKQIPYILTIIVIIFFL